MKREIDILTEEYARATENAAELNASIRHLVEIRDRLRDYQNQLSERIEAIRGRGVECHESDR